MSAWWDERAARFHEANPHVYRDLVRYARAAHRRGAQRIGIGMIFEVLRWQTAFRTNDPSGWDFKLNNNYRAWYAREIMRREADLVGIFTTRHPITRQEER